MQWAYYWYYSALGCHGHLVRDIQFSLFHHHYLWGHLLWKMNSASFAWLISNFFFIYLTEGHMPGIWSSWKKKCGEKKAYREHEWECVHQGTHVEVKQIPQAREPIALHLSVLPGRHFFPKLLHTKQRESFPRSLLEAPWFFLLIVGGCILFYVLFPGLWVMVSILTEDKKQPFLHLGGRHIPHPPFRLVVERVFFSSGVCWASTVNSTESVFNWGAVVVMLWGMWSSLG